MAEKEGCRLEILNAVVAVNLAQQERMVAKIQKLVGELSGKRLAFLGLAFKPNTDDIRESPALFIIRAIQKLGGEAVAYDPAAMEEAKRVLSGVKFASDAYEAAEGADAVVLVTEWNQFRNLDLPRIKETMRRPVFLDFRNVYEPAKMTALGFQYDSVGRPNPQG
jgi:UDPglucose 6-dehydrogenase